MAIANFVSVAGMAVSFDLRLCLRNKNLALSSESG